MSRALLLALLLASTAVSADPLRFRVIYGEIPNLVYQLDCVSGALTSCSKDAYQQLWDRDILRDDADRAALGRWKAVAQRYGGSLDLPVPVELPLGSRGHRIDLYARIRVAGVLARSVEEYVDRVGVIVLPADQAALAEVITRFEPRFRAVWERSAPAGRAFAAELEQLLARPDLVALVDQMRALYEAELPGDRPLPFVVLDRPALGEKKGTFAQQLEGVSLLEFIPGDKAARKMAVVIHELCHFFYFTARPALMSGLQQRFAAAKAVGGFRIFDEAVATALGNGMVQRLVARADFEARLARPNGFYNDPDIDRAAKALLPFLDRWLPTGKTFADPGFVDAYVAALTETLGQGLVAPRLGLFAVVLFVEGSLPRDLLDALGRVAHLNEWSEMGGKVDDPALGPWLATAQGTGLFVVPPQQVAGLVKLGLLTKAEAASLARRKRAVMLGKAWRRGETLYAIVATERTAIEGAFARIASAKAPVLGLTDLD
jgi:hypothetical protein